MTPKDPSQIALKDTVGIVCELCGHHYFEERFLIRKISKFIVGSTRDILNTIPVLACAKCGHVNDDMNVLKSANDDEKSI
jgi:hypothetical protein